MRILLVRHGESEANVDKSLLTRQPDHAIRLSTRGEEQAAAAGSFLTKWFIEDGPGASPSSLFPPMGSHVGSGKFPFRMWTSPYKRARQTADGILAVMEQEAGAVPASGRHEHVHLAEQQFGLFDGLSEEELIEKYPREQEHYKRCESFEGRFWARMPLGESRFDVALRVHQAFGTFHRDAEKHGINTIVVVAHGTTIRAFVMQWLHKPFEWFEKEPNPANCSVRLIDGKEDRGYIHPGGSA